MSDLLKLREDHSKLTRLFMQLGRIIESSDPPSNIELFDLRRDLISTLLTHLKLEDWALYPRLMECGEDDIASAARAFKDEMGSLAPDFLAYCDKWNATSIEADWPGYCTDTRLILDALNNRVTRENRELLPLLDRLDRAA